MTRTYGRERGFIKDSEREKKVSVEKTVFLKIDFKELVCREKQKYNLKWTLFIIVYFFAGLICRFH